VLSIAGSDSGGGAGVQADLKAFARCGVHGMTAVTAITAQNTVAVSAVHPVPGDVIVEQVRAVVDDIGVDAVKIGMLGSLATIEAVGEALDLVGEAPVVLDPVMISESGARLLAEDAQDALRTQLVPRAAVVTPNVPEARVLALREGGDARREAGGLAEAGGPGEAGGLAEAGGPTEAGGPGGGPGEAGGVLAEGDEAAAEELVRAVHALGPRAVVLTGGHREWATDLFFDGERLVEIPGERYASGSAHGSGCTHSSALAAHLALGLAPLEAARQAKRIASEAVRDGLKTVGQGPGPVDVFGLER
jgi:hydroxymethylpyrimidine/phosphomethylpyrimidine kinase